MGTRRRWGGVPETTTGILSWAHVVARTRATTDPHLVRANQDAEQVRSEQQRLIARHSGERASLRRRVVGELPLSTAGTRTVPWRGRAEQSRLDLAEIEALPVIEAAQLVRERAARVQAERAAAERAQAARDARAAKLDQLRSASDDRRRPAQDYGVGPGL